MESYPMRVSPDGRDVAIRNLHKIVTVTDDGPQWNTISSQWLTDAQVADWMVLAPQGDIVTAQKKGFLWEVLVNDEIVATPSTAYVGEVVFDRVFRAPGRQATVVCKNSDLSAVHLIHPDTKA